MPGRQPLRGVQQTDADGSVRFVSVVPGCHAPRMPKMPLALVAIAVAA